MDRMRTFIAYALPQEVLSAIGSVQEDIRTKGFSLKWVAAANVHLTLKFLGDVEQSHIPAITSALEQTGTAHSPMNFRAKGVGVFPGVKNARVLWIGLSGDILPLRALQQDLEERLSFLGFPKEKRPFNGHLTIARVKSPLAPKEILNILECYSGFTSEPFILDALTLFRSTLTPQGARYHEVAKKTVGN